MSADVPAKEPLHPAKFTDSILEVMRRTLDDNLVEGLGLDPFAGVGRMGLLDVPGVRHTIGVEIEEPWVEAARELGRDVRLGDSTRRDFGIGLEPGSVDYAVTSPTYGNRFADKHRARDGSVRRSYTHDLRRLTGDEEYQLADTNTGGEHWGKRYWLLHKVVWGNLWHAMRDGGVLVLNVSDHVRAGEVVPVANWHRRALEAVGFSVKTEEQVDTPRMRMGANHRARVGWEMVYVFEKEPF